MNELKDCKTQVEVLAWVTDWAFAMNEYQGSLIAKALTRMTEIARRDAYDQCWHLVDKEWPEADGLLDGISALKTKESAPD